MNKPTAYLAGPITGLSYEGCTDWRVYAAQKLAPEIIAFSPLRAKPYLLGKTTIADTHEEHILSSQRGIYTRDHYDCRARDLLLINVLGAQRVSIGTMMEVGWGTAYNKLMVLVMEREGNIHEHSMLREACPFRVETLDEGIEIAKALLLPAINKGV